MHYSMPLYIRCLSVQILAFTGFLESILSRWGGGGPTVVKFGAVKSYVQVFDLHGVGATNTCIIRGYFVKDFSVCVLTFVFKPWFLVLPFWDLVLG